MTSSNKNIKSVILIVTLLIPLSSMYDSTDVKKKTFKYICNASKSDLYLINVFKIRLKMTLNYIFYKNVTKTCTTRIVEILLCPYLLLWNIKTTIFFVTSTLVSRQSCADIKVQENFVLKLIFLVPFAYSFSHKFFGWHSPRFLMKFNSMSMRNLFCKW